MPDGAWYMRNLKIGARATMYDIISDCRFSYGTQFTFAEKQYISMGNPHSDGCSWRTIDII